MKKENTKEVKQRFVVNATGDGKAFSTKVVEVNPDSVDGAQKIYAKEGITIETLTTNKPIRLNEVNFSTSSQILNGKSMDILDELVTFLKLKPTMVIEIHGHTDNRGEVVKNLELSKRRAKSVMDFLIYNGIDSTRLASKGFGPNKPKASNKTKKGRSFNRRVEFVIKTY
jgi:outer membrane protein OmpA-like peptidoglycan-associated protein